MSLSLINLRQKVCKIISQQMFCTPYLSLFCPTFLSLKKDNEFSVVLRLRTKAGRDKGYGTVLKLVRIHGNQWDPASCREICIIMDLQKFLFSGMCLHFPLLFSSNQQIAGIIVPPLQQSPWGNQCVGTLLTEFAPLGTVFSYFIQMARLRGAGPIFDVVIFQVVYSIALLQWWFPGIRHNDLHTLNILLAPGNPDEFTQYTLPTGKTYWVPNLIRAILWDFELAWSPNHPNRAICSSMDEEAGIQLVPSTCYDLHFFLNSCYCYITQQNATCSSNRHYQSIAASIRNLYNGEFLGRNESKYIKNFRLRSSSVLQEESLPIHTPLELLNNPEKLGWNRFKRYVKRPLEDVIVNECSFYAK